MPRVGRHPLKQKGLVNDINHNAITITTIVHIPALESYWEQSLDVLKLFFDSLLASTDLPFDLMVFDNNSCAEVQDYLLQLQRDDVIQYLTLSQYNLRKLGALNYLLSTAPGDFVAFADSDVYFLPGWLESSLAVLDAFPEAAKVTALPVVGGDTSEISKRDFEKIQADSTILVNTGVLVPDEFVRSHRLSLGRDEAQYETRLAGRKDVLLTRDNVQAYLSGADFQFTIRKEALQKTLPLQIETADEYFDPIYSPVLEHRLGKFGYWQLSTAEYLVHHMGNRPPDLTLELPWLEMAPGDTSGFNSSKVPRGGSSNRDSHTVFDRPKVRRFLKAVNRKTYELLYDH